jgi:xanthine dehydrogenase YagS FAD-binding subunit
MMNNFAYVKAGSLAEAVRELSTERAWLHAGGTDLLGCAHDRIFPIDKVVSISGLRSLKGIDLNSSGGIRIGAMTPLAEIARNARVAQRCPVLAQAAAAVGSPQLREQGTLGGNLCQKPRCWYYRRDFRCFKKGGGTCYALDGENQYHAVFGNGPCFFVHPSDTAVALTALRARLSITGPAGNRVVSVDNFFVPPDKAIARENILLSGEIITEIEIPAGVEKAKSSYRKVGPRAAWDFALASAAVVLEMENEVVHSARVVLGGVAPLPWRVEAAEKILTGGKLDRSLVTEAAEAAIEGARPLNDNAYKLEIVKGVLKESLTAFI